jgi:hypothetical protein
MMHQNKSARMLYIDTMLKEIQAGFSKFFTKKWIPIIILLVICFVLITYSSFKGTVVDKMTDGSSAMNMQQASGAPAQVASAAAAVAPSAPSQSASQGGYTAQAVANPSDLLPTDQNSQWATLNPSGNNVAIPDLLQAGYHIGLDTIGQTLKNANYQLRSDPIIEKKDVGPWLMSTIEPDFARVPLEIGQGCR